MIGVILAACLQEVWRVQFVPAIGTAVRESSGCSNGGENSDCCGSDLAEAELFNIYGPLRVVRNCHSFFSFRHLIMQYLLIGDPGL